MGPTFTEEELAAMQAVAWGERVGDRPNLWTVLLRLNLRHPSLVTDYAHLSLPGSDSSLEWGWTLTDEGRAVLADLGRLPPNPNDQRPRVVA